MTQKRSRISYGPPMRRTARPNLAKQIEKDVHRSDFPVNGACSKLPPERKNDFTNADTGSHVARKRAIAVCTSCPVWETCLEWATKTKQTGVFGGEWLRNGKVASGYVER